MQQTAAARKCGGIQMIEPGEINAALRAGYRVTVHDEFFPFTAHTGELIHAKVDHGARAVFCSTEWAQQLPKDRQ